MQDLRSLLIENQGVNITILRDAGNISDKCILVPNKFASKAFLLEYQKDAFFKWDSQIKRGDIFKSLLTEEYYIVAFCNFEEKANIKIGKKAMVYKSNNYVTLYNLVSSLDTSFGQHVYNWYVKLVDYACVSYYVKGDTITPIGEMGYDKLFVLFSGRKLGTYVPVAGDRIVLQNGLKLQIDGLDPHLYLGCYEAICSADQRV